MEARFSFGRGRSNRLSIVPWLLFIWSGTVSMDLDRLTDGLKRILPQERQGFWNKQSTSVCNNPEFVKDKKFVISVTEEQIVTSVDNSAQAESDMQPGQYSLESVVNSMHWALMG
ncbi:hypothetical protein GCK72_008513 [Caenorhabditis remanei]|uniref:Uncharacterized protein n=1 Tax=Caenorhabditis remanei TaxID=31234 RepID=A0A6A5GYW2_CAERE|nr:hypothetical protein GCK72_008513 [Caenorhabditis remanei]KAF1760267.1 hypothetical protein GCK72_008513 [Caenorhabditis remanei]